MRSVRTIAKIPFLFLIAVGASWALSPAALAADCVDSDGDGFVDCTAGCTAPAGKTCGECDDSDPAIKPGATEVCDGADNDCDDAVDEGFAGEACAFCDGPDCLHTFCIASGPNEDCSTMTGAVCKSPGGGVVCSAGGDPVCSPGPTPKEIYAAEGLGENLAANVDEATCGDFVDNDCDGVIDREDPGCFIDAEVLCDGLDDDGNGEVDETFDLGEACSFGTGLCYNAGVEVCTADRSGTMCSVEAHPAGSEDVPGGTDCTDDLDNDCDGLTDILDPDCQTDEVCDGADNDGDLDVDEGFDDLGAPCVVGTSHCQVEGVMVCGPGGTETVCNATARAATAEGPFGLSCRDDEDNDCDGLVDSADPGCLDPGAAWVSCALEPIRKPAKLDPTSCEGQYRVVIDHNLGPDAEVSAEILALNPDGTPIAYEPNVVPIANGEEVHLASRTDPGDFRVDQRGRFTDVLAPVPLVVVTAHTGDRIQKAFCSPIAYLDVMKPNGQVVSASERDVIEVEVALTRVDPSTLSVLIDGVDILAALGLDPAVDFPGGSYGGQVMIDGELVTISGLIVDTAAPGELSSNSLTMVVEDLGGGGHIVLVDGEPCDGLNCPNAVGAPSNDGCHLDNVADAGTASVFEVRIAEPEDGGTVPPGATQVLAQVRHGRDITYASVGGVSVTTAGQVCGTTEFTVDDETFSVGECELDVDTVVGQTNFNDPMLELGTFDLGENIVTVMARDDIQSQTSDRHRFAMGDTVAPALPPEAVSAIKSTVSAVRAQAIQNVGIGLKYGYVFGMSPEGLNTYYQSTCDRAAQTVEDSLRTTLMNVEYPRITASLHKHYNVTLTLKTTSVTFEGDLTCTVVPQDGYLAVNVALPEITITVSVKGSKRYETPVTGICLISVSVDTTASTTLTGAGVSFHIHEFHVQYGGSAFSTYHDGTFSEFVVARGGVDIGCIGGVIDDFFTFMSFGLLNAEVSMSDAVEDQLESDDTDDAIQVALRASSPDPLSIQKLGFDESGYIGNGLSLIVGMEDVRITASRPDLQPPAGGGLVAAYGLGVSVYVSNEEVLADGIPQIPVTEAPLPQLPVTGSKDIFFSIADEAFSLVFAAMTMWGHGYTQCVPGVSPVVVGDLLPDDCSALDAAAARARCHGAKGVDCRTLPNDEVKVCETTAEDLASRNISAATGVLFCGRASLAARMLFFDDPSTYNVESLIHINDMPISMVLDLDGNGGAGYWADIPNCLGLLPGAGASDCKWARGCFDVDLASELWVFNSSEPRIMRDVLGVSDHVGFQCDGGMYFGDDSNLLGLSGGSDPITTISDNIDVILPYFQTQGLNLGGFVALDNGSVDPIAIDSGVASNDDCTMCQDFVGLTGEINPYW